MNARTLTAKQRRRYTIGRLTKTYEKFKALHHSKFVYSDFVAKHEEDEQGNICGTVCCIMGWHPQWYPKHFKWILLLGGSYMNVVPIDNNRKPLNQSLREFYGIDNDLIDCLFYGSRNLYVIIDGKRKYIRAKNGQWSSKAEVSKLFRKVLKMIELGYLDQHLILERLTNTRI